MRKLWTHAQIMALMGMTLSAWGEAGDRPPPRGISFKTAMRTALSKNMDIKIAQLDEALGQTHIDAAESIFDPLFTSSINWEDDQSKQSSIVFGTKTITRHYDFGLAKNMLWGAKFELKYLNEFTDTNSKFATLNPAWEPRLSLTLTQPILNNFFGTLFRRELKQAELKNQILKTQSKDTIEGLLKNIAYAYWEFSAAQAILKIKKQALQQAQKLYSANRRKLKLGTIEKTDLLASEANVRARENDILGAQNAQETAAANLKQALQDETADPLTARDPLTFQEAHFSIEKTLSRTFALQKEYLKAQKELEQKNVILRMKKNARLPELDIAATITYNGLDTHYDPAFEDVKKVKNPTAFLGVRLSYPFGNHAAKRDFNQSRIARLTALYHLQKLQNDIRTDVSKKIHVLNTLKKQVRAAEAIEKLNKKKMLGEEEKFNRGRSSINFVIQFQEEYLASSENRMQVLLDYEKAVIDLKRAEGTLLERALNQFL